jgi:hypothetical protein
MTRLSTVALAGVLAVALSFFAPAAIAEPAPVAMPVISMSIEDGAGGRDKLTLYGMLQPKRDRHVARVKARASDIAAAFKSRIRFIESKQLIPPEGNTDWLEKELWALAEHMLKPIQLNGAFFTELSIE